jgi:hypothetical protein
MGPIKDASAARIAAIMSGLASFRIVFYKRAINGGGIAGRRILASLLSFNRQSFVTPTQNQLVYLSKLGALFLAEMVLFGSTCGHKAFPGELSGL